MRLTLPMRIRLFSNCSVKLLRWILLLMAFVLSSHPAWAFEAPTFQGDVLDEVGILSAADKDALQLRIRELRDNSGIWAAVYVARSLQQDAIENAAVTTFQKWKLGQAGKENGLLVLIVPSERKMRIEVGYGLEGFITDAFSKRVIDEIYKPAFREQHFAKGILQGFDVMAKMASGEPMASAPDAPVEIDWSAVLRNFALVFGLNLIPGILYAWAFVYGRSKGRSESGSLWKNVRFPLIFGGFFGFIFGLFISIFGAAFVEDPQIVMVLAVMNVIFTSFYLFVFAPPAWRFVSDSAYRRNLARAFGADPQALQKSTRDFRCDVLSE